MNARYKLHNEEQSGRVLMLVAAVALVIFGAALAPSFFGPSALAVNTRQSSLDGFEAHLEQRGCVVANIAHSRVTRYRCDTPQPGAYTSRAELLAEYTRAVSARDTH